jgi:hypothetical protein
VGHGAGGESATPDLFDHNRPGVIPDDAPDLTGEDLHVNPGETGWGETHCGVTEGNRRDLGDGEEVHVFSGVECCRHARGVLHDLDQPRLSVVLYSYLSQTGRVWHTVRG